MIHSMTGYGKTDLNTSNATFTIELKSLNSKQIDLNVKMSSVYRDKEIQVRKILAEKLKRGKIELSIWREKSDQPSSYTFNTTVLKDYHTQILKLKKDLDLEELELDKADLIPTLLKMPEAILKGREKIDEQEWKKITIGINEAIDNLNEYRLSEGVKLEQDIIKRIGIIEGLLTKIRSFSKERIEKTKKDLKDKMDEFEIKDIDDNRFEQELIYYLEKQDITEEQVRLKAHLGYFLETMETDFPNGKKLGFISQEIGREINTIGSKSSNADMQRIIVQMKDELEKIKEQLLNIL
jgi:uncharacterized protein (TIGR00255 family)